ncbi:hypothetical protein GCM10011369_19080 [Neiella marina]|uniref:Uncharacterized protein n=1 Tax=Neiella marina TaxID=508461 RepID=A0A8J2XP09_9GAMM|nr:hypothetical protein GCM10011369_19080 [Neiella marina]
MLRSLESKHLSDQDLSELAPTADCRSHPDAASEVHLSERLWNSLKEHFKQDKQITDFLNATERNLKKGQIVDEVFGGCQRTFDSVRRRLIRKSRGIEAILEATK